MASELSKLGAAVEPTADGMIIHGRERLQGGVVTSYGDHRIAMSCAIASLVASGPVTIGDTACTETSFPGFWEFLESIRS
jgi:3-phosphoshikimate 1-carboxyvinyltransferase